MPIRAILVGFKAVFQKKAHVITTKNSVITTIANGFEFEPVQVAQQKEILVLCKARKTH
jgi:hypothetical protein